MTYEGGEKKMEEILTAEELQEFIDGGKYEEKREQEFSEMFRNQKCIPYCLNGNYRK